MYCLVLGLFSSAIQAVCDTTAGAGFIFILFFDYCIVLHGIELMQVVSLLLC